MVTAGSEVRRIIMKNRYWIQFLAVGLILSGLFMSHSSGAAIADDKDDSAQAAPEDSGAITGDQYKAALNALKGTSGESCPKVEEFGVQYYSSCTKVRDANGETAEQCINDLSKLRQRPGCEIPCTDWRDWNPDTGKCDKKHDKAPGKGLAHGGKPVVYVCDTASGAVKQGNTCVCPTNLVVNKDLGPVDAKGDATAVHPAGDIRHISCVTKVTATIRDAEAKRRQIEHICTLDLSNYGLSADEKAFVLNHPDVDQGTKDLMRKVEGVSTLSYEDKCVRTQAALVYLLMRLRANPTDQTVIDAKNNPKYKDGLDNADQLADMYAYYLQLKNVIIPDILNRLGKLEKKVQEHEDRLNLVVPGIRLEFGGLGYAALRPSPQSGTIGVMAWFEFVKNVTPRNGWVVGVAGGYGHSVTKRFGWYVRAGWQHNIVIPEKADGFSLSTILGAQVVGEWLNNPVQQDSSGAGPFFALPLRFGHFVLSPEIAVVYQQGAAYRDIFVNNAPPVRERTLHYSLEAVPALRAGFWF